MKFLGFLVLAALNITLQALVVKIGWNLFSESMELLPHITFFQAIGLVLFISTLRGKLEITYNK